MKIVAKTDIGLRRDSNQDSYASGELFGSVAWAVVCDGMGGVEGGSLASQIGVDVISERIKSLYREDMSVNSIRNMLTSAITAANIKIYETSKTDVGFEGMGTTVVSVIVADNVVYVAHLGDSRAYVLSDDNLYQLTKDHSVVQELVDSGLITKEEAASDPRKNIITRALGVSDDVHIDFAAEDIKDNDIVVLCTDGLTNFVSEKTICEFAKGNFDDFAECLVNEANANGGGDNITVVAITD